MLDRGSSLFIFITNNCNLKCLGCMQSCDRIKDPYYLSLKDLEEQLLIIKEKKLVVNNLLIDTIHLTGGDPLTHHDFIDMCKLVHKILPEYNLDVSTNGILLNKLTDEELLYLENELKVKFQLSIYPHPSLFKMYEKLKDRFKKLNLYISFFGGSHFFFSKQSLCNSKTSIPERGYCNRCIDKINSQSHVILYKGNLYSCWNDINFLQIDEHPNHNPLKLIDTKENQNVQQINKHYFCNLCEKNNGAGGAEFMVWQHHNKNADIVFKTNYNDLYVNNYDIYYQLQEGNQDYIPLLSNPFFQENLPEDQKYYANTRYLDGKGDIFIPFDDFIPCELRDILKAQKNIIDYNLYFVSICNNKINSKKIEEEIFSIFGPYRHDQIIKTYFLKANDLYGAYKVFLKNSYLKEKYILDVKTFELTKLS